MNLKIACLAIVVATPMVASAQETTLDYQGNIMGGTSTVVAVPFEGGPTGVPSSPIFTTATFDASVTYSGSVAQNNLVIDSFAINLIANNGQKFELQDILPSSQGYVTNGTSLCGLGAMGVSGCLTLTTSGDTVTGATIDLQNPGNYHGTVADVTIGPSGDSFSERDGYGGVFGCSGDRSVGVFTYVGSNSASPCSMNVSDSTAGRWTVAAPEIDPASMASSLTLLLGGFLVLRGRRTIETRAI